MTESVVGGIENIRELVAFTTGAQEFCVDIGSVKEIRGWTPATPVPHSPKFIKGVINLRGVVIPILDLGARLGLRTVEPSQRHVIIVSQIREKIVGLLVDAVSDILSIDEVMIQTPPQIASQLALSFISGVVALDGRMLSILGLESLLPHSEIELAK